MNEAAYVKHHKEKVAFLFSAMRHFAEELKQGGYRIIWPRVLIPKGASTAEEERITSEAIECAQIQNVGREVGVIQRIII